MKESGEIIIGAQLLHDMTSTAYSLQLVFSTVLLCRAELEWSGLFVYTGS
jgi:hypothetical protein